MCLHALNNLYVAVHLLSNKVYMTSCFYDALSFIICIVIAAVSGACFFLFGLLCGVSAGTYVRVTLYIKWNKNGRESQSSHRQPTCASQSHNNIEVDAITGPPVEPQLQQNVAYEHVGKC